ncbi:hypothetical protein XHV734_3867 [Xanthomonas hortorum pv. vitians]|nr:hypothetical protein XHV734_3867 [Xanthomonas hortorum pv. vitians]
MIQRRLGPVLNGDLGFGSRDSGFAERVRFCFGITNPQFPIPNSQSQDPAHSVDEMGILISTIGG